MKIVLHEEGTDSLAALICLYYLCLILLNPAPEALVIYIQI